jgi:hypothetical protein
MLVDYNNITEVQHNDQKTTFVYWSTIAKRLLTASVYVKNVGFNPPELPRDCKHTSVTNFTCRPKKGAHFQCRVMNTKNGTAMCRIQTTFPLGEDK